jgi:hypothetical protein
LATRHPAIYSRVKIRVNGKPYAPPRAPERALRSTGAIRGGRTYKVPATRLVDLQLQLSLFDLLRLLITGEEEHAGDQIWNRLTQAWKSAAGLQLEDASEPVI